MFSAVGLLLDILITTFTWASNIARLMFAVWSRSTTIWSLGGCASAERLITWVNSTLCDTFWIIDGPMVYHLFLRITTWNRIIFSFDINFIIENMRTDYLDTHLEQPGLRRFASAPRAATLAPILQKYIKYIFQHWYF